MYFVFELLVGLLAVLDKVLFGEVAWQGGILTLDLFWTVDTWVPKVVARDIYDLEFQISGVYPLSGGGHNGGRPDA